MTDRRDEGMRVRREVLGGAHVDRAEAAGTAFDAPFRAMIAEGAWGTLWADDTIPRRERSMLTVALLAALGNWEELALHLRATPRTGASREDVMQALLHVAVYAGVPRANRAVSIAKAVFAEIDAEEAAP
jgi:4-carboxymuconolactone decarboxylase